MSRFHVVDGLYFSRTDDFTVRIQKYESAKDGAPLVWECEIPEASWISIIPHVTRGVDPNWRTVGSNSEGFNEKRCCDVECTGHSPSDALAAPVWPSKDIDDV